MRTYIFVEWRHLTGERLAHVGAFAGVVVHQRDQRVEAITSNVLIRDARDVRAIPIPSIENCSAGAANAVTRSDAGEGEEEREHPEGERGE